MDKLEQAVTAILDTFVGYDRQPDGTFTCEIYADYRDEMDNKTAIKILRSDDPMQAFWEQLDEWYMDYRWTLEDELENTVMDKLLTGPYADGIPGEDYERIHDVIQDLVWFKLPADHFLKQSFYVDIMVDAGDGNYDYTLNSAYPCWYGAYGDPIDPKAGIAWLAKSQGYTKGRLKKALRDGDMADPHWFLESMRVELANLSTAMSTVTLVEQRYLSVHVVHLPLSSPLRLEFAP